MFKGIVILLVLVTVCQSHVIEKRFFGNINNAINNIGGAITGTVDQVKAEADKLAKELQNAAAFYQGTFESAMKTFSATLQVFLDDFNRIQMSLNEFAKQINSNLNSISTDFPYQIFDHPAINLPFMKDCVKVAYEPTKDNKNSCIKKLFPEVKECVDAVDNPTNENVAKCAKLLGVVNTGIEYCLNLVSAQTEENAMGCAALVANMIVPNAGAPLSITMKCKKIAANPTYETISKCTLEVLNALEVSLGVHFPFLNDNTIALADCIAANAQSPPQIIESCANSLSQIVNLGPLKEIIDIYNQCKTTDANSIRTCVAKMLEKESKLAQIPFDLQSSLSLLA